MLNTLEYSVLGTLGLVVSSVPVAYALARLRWRGRQAMFMVVLVALMLPPQVTVVPLYVMWAKFHPFGFNFIGTLWPIILPNWFGDAFSIFLLRQFFLTIPEEYLDAARVDGCGELRILGTVVVRLAKPAIVAVALFSFLYTFNDFFLPLLYTGEAPHHWVLSIGLSQFRSLHQVQWNLTMAATLLVMVPVVVIFFLAQTGVRRGRDVDGREGMKIAVVGAGSTYTPELVSGLGSFDVPIDALALMDVDDERLDVVGGLATRMLDRTGWRGELSLTTDLDRAVDGADFVLVQIRVGGQAARLRDETIPLACGCIGQETTGAGGFAKAMRTVPVMLQIADRVRELAADDAWIVDFTNPVGIVTRSLLDAGHRAVGLCNVAIGFQRHLAHLLGVEPQRVVVDQVGLNHLTWVRRVLLDDRDVLPELLDAHADELAEHTGMERSVLNDLAVLPSYYLHYFYDHDRVLEELHETTPRAAAVAEIERRLLEMYRDPALTTKPALLEQRGGAFYSEAAVGLVASLVRDDGAVHEVDVRNNGVLAGLADDDVVEVPARVRGGVIEPLPQEPLAPELLGLTQHVTAYERLAAEAAVTRDPVTARKALLAHPLIGQVAQIDALLDAALLESEVPR